ncbi:MFS transporter [Actinoplanes aureus]|uniref:MFS transporter n=1 Tax=Actinoplanes aureus TaxID=2792083 RepID=A0A931C459_9ACTN|nr:MFS transporter [Actinoplanes aureus]MBG0560108.1 MFS transporter [Actinoplanes aureus]
MSGSRPVIGLACAVQFIDVVGVTVLAVALPAIQHDLRLSPAELSWAAAIYALAFGGLLILGGRAADLVGRRLMFVLGNAVVVAGSVLCAVANDAAVLLAGRALQGIGAAASVPAALASILAVVPVGPSRGRALGLWTMAGAVGGVSGFVLGGVVTEFLGWRWLFVMVAAVALVAAVAAPPVLPADRNRRDRQPLDILGATLITGTALLVMMGLQRAESDGFTAVSFWLPLLLAPAVATGFAMWERRVPAPLVPPHLWSMPTFRLGAGTAFAVTATTSGSSIVTMLFLQDELHLSPGRSGTVFLLLSGAVAATSLAAPAAVRSLGTPLTMAAGFAVIAAAMFTQAVGASLRSLPVFLLGLVLTGAGLGLASVASTTHGTTGADETTSGVIGGLLNAAAQIGTAVGIAALLTTTTTWPNPENGPQAAYGLAALTCLAAVAAATRSAHRDHQQAERTTTTAPE